MARKHLHTIGISCTSPDADIRNLDVSPDHPDYAERRNRILRPHNMLRRADCLLGFIGDALRKAKVVTSSPRITELHIYLTDVPRDQPEYYRGGERWDLSVDIAYPVMSLADLPMDNKTLSEFFIEIVMQALEKASDYPELPREIIIDACARFRARGYKFSYKIGEGKIDGTAVKGRLDAVASSVSTERYFSATYRGKELFRTQILGDDDGPNLGMRRSYNGFVWSDDVITVKESYWLEFIERTSAVKDWAKPYDIHLNAFPDAQASIRTKLV